MGDHGEKRLVPYEVVEGMTSLSRRHLERMVKDGRFPQPVKIGRAVRFDVGEVWRWLREQTANRVQTAALPVGGVRIAALPY